MVAHSRICRAETPELMAIKVRFSGGTRDVIKLANLGADRLRGFGLASGRILAFAINLHRRSYNTFALQTYSANVR